MMVILKKIVRVRFSEDEYEMLCGAAKEDRGTRYKNGRANLSGYVRKCVLQCNGAHQDAMLQKEVRNLSYQVRKIGVNINQATKKINSGFGQKESCEELQRDLKKLHEKFDAALGFLEREDGSHKINEH